MTKTCQVCHKLKPISDFYRHPVSKNAEYLCRTCKLAAARLDVRSKRQDLEFRKSQAKQLASESWRWAE